MIPQTQTGLCFDIDVIQSQGYELSKDDKRYLKEVEEKQAQLHAKLKAMKQLTADEEQALNCATHDEFAGFWSRYCDRAHEEFVDKHEHGWRRWTKKSQDYAKEVEDFMNDFKPAIDAAKEFGKPWSGIAIGTLAFLFVAGSKKHQIEEQIAATLEGIRDRLSGFQMLEQCYDGPNELEAELRKRILLAHLAFIELAVEITKYYFYRGYRRVMIATFRFSKLKQLSAKLNERIIAVRRRCEELIHVKLRQIEENSKRAVLTNVSNFITELQELLLIPTWSRALDREELESYRQKLQDEAFLEENYEKISLDSVERCGLGNAIAQWEKSGQSSMLILTGINNTEISMIKVHCWLSPLAIEIVDRQRDIRGPWAFFRFHGPNRRTISKAIPVLVAQFLSQNRSTLELDMPTLTSHARAFSRLVNGGTHTDDRNERITDVLCQLLFHVVKIFGQKETVTLVIDCLDACDEQERNDFLRMMIGLLNNAGCTVKILVVTQWVSDWRPNERELRSLLKRETPLQFESREQGYLWY